MNIIYIYSIYNWILLSHKEEWNNVICSNMDRPRDYHTKCSEPDMERQVSHDITYMLNPIFKNWKWYKWTYLQNRKRLTDIKDKLMTDYQRRNGRRDKSGAGMNTHTLLVRRYRQPTKTFYIAHGDLLNILWYPSWERMNIDICIIESLYCTPETNTTL